MDKAIKRAQAVRAGLKTVLLFGSLLATPAYAASATPEGAKELQASVARVIGLRLFEMGVASIAPQGDAYAFKLDFNVLSAKANAAGVKFSIDPLVYMLTPKDDGTYAVTSDSPLSYSFRTGAGSERLETEVYAECKGSGVFDPTILSFSSYEESCGEMTGSLISGTEKEAISSGGMSIKLTGKASATGGTDLSLVTNVLDYVDKIEPLKGAELPVTVSVKSMSSEITLENARLANILSIVSPPATEYNPKERNLDEAKKRIVAALPFWNSIEGRTILSNIRIETMFGTFKIDNVEGKIGLTGAVKEANMWGGLKYSGLQLPNLSIPAWGKALIPTEGNVDVELGSTDLDAAFRFVVESFDVTKVEPLGSEVAVELLMMVVSNPPKLTLAPSALKARVGEVSAAGSMILLPNQKGRFIITATNLDKIIETLKSVDIEKLQYADEETKKNLMMAAFLVKGMAKSGEDGKSIWEIDFDKATREITINGQKLGGNAPSVWDEE